MVMPHQDSQRDITIQAVQFASTIEVIGLSVNQITIAKICLTVEDGTK